MLCFGFMLIGFVAYGEIPPEPGQKSKDGPPPPPSSRLANRRRVISFIGFWRCLWYF